MKNFILGFMVLAIGAGIVYAGECADGSCRLPRRSVTVSREKSSDCHSEVVTRSVTRTRKARGCHGASAGCHGETKAGCHGEVKSGCHGGN